MQTRQRINSEENVIDRIKVLLKLIKGCIDPGGISNLNIKLYP
jgi:hypothetical protein